MNEMTALQASANAPNVTDILSATTHCTSCRCLPDIDWHCSNSLTYLSNIAKKSLLLKHGAECRRDKLPSICLVA